MTPAPPQEDTRPRNPHESRSTGIIQSILGDPAGAAYVLREEIQSGASPALVSGLLDTAANFARLRGVVIAPQVAQIRLLLKQAGHEV